jgi:hypothetical protein
MQQRMHKQYKGATVDDTINSEMIDSTCVVCLLLIASAQEVRWCAQWRCTTVLIALAHFRMIHSAVHAMLHVRTSQRAFVETHRYR